MLVHDFHVTSLGLRDPLESNHIHAASTDRALLCARPFGSAVTHPPVMAAQVA